MHIRRTIRSAASVAVLPISFVFAAAFVGSSCASDRQVIAQAESAHTELEPAIVDDPKIDSYLKSIGDRITQAARDADREGIGPKSHFDKKQDNAWMFSEGQFHLVSSDVLNAFTTGGEHMYIYSELMRTCRSEDELAAVMAHEYAHVYARHVHKGMNRQMTAAFASTAAGVVGVAVGGEEHGEEYASMAMVSAATVGQFLNSGYTREDEAEADKLGFQFFARAGWNPEHFGDFFQQLIDKGFDKTPEMLSDHPSLASRVAEAKKRAANLPPEAASWRKPPVADAAAFDDLKDHAAQVAAATAKSKDAATAELLLAAVPSCLLPEDQPEQKEAQRSLVQALEQGSSSPRP